MARPVFGNIKSRATKAQKEKNNFQRQKDILSLYDLYKGNFRDRKRIDYLDVNYGLFNGKLDINLYDDPLCFDIGEEKITFDYQNISHYPLISQVANAIVGEAVNRPFVPMVKDNTPSRQNLVKKEMSARVTEFIQRNYLEPLRRQALDQILAGSGFGDIFDASPDQQQEIKQAVDAQVLAQTPEDIRDYLELEYQTPTARQAQKILDYIVEYSNVKWEQIEGFKHAVITGEEYYYEGVRNNSLVFESVNPKYFEWGGSLETEWVQEATWCKRETWLTYEDAMQRHAEHLTPKDIRNIEYFVEPIGGFRSDDFYNGNNPAHKKLMYEFSRDEGLQKRYGDIDIRQQKKYQGKIADLYSEVFDLYGPEYGYAYSNYGIREAHIQFRDETKFKKVTRNENGSIQTYYVRDHYEATHKDIEIETIWINEVWEGWILGTFDPVYVNVRRVPHQFKSLSNPYNTNLSYYGKKYNTHKNNSKNVSLIDLGKVPNKDFDLTMAQLKHDMATNYGQMFMLFLNMKPDAWKWQEWLSLARNSRLLITDPHKHGLNGIDPQFLRNINMSNSADIAQKIQLLEYQRRTVALSMYFNDSRIGEIGQYATNETTQSNVSASYNQTALFFSQHTEIVERALSGHLNRARMFFKENPQKAAVFLDEVSIAELMSSKGFHYDELGITINNSGEEMSRLNLLKQQTVSFIQNGASPESVMELMFADTSAEVRDIMKRETRRLDQQRQEAIQNQQQAQQAELQAKAEDKDKDRQLKYQMHLETLQSQEARSAIEVEKFSRSSDIDQDKVNDAITRTIIDNQFENERHLIDAEIEHRKLDLDERELEAKRQELKEKLKSR